MCWFDRLLQSSEPSPTNFKRLQSGTRKLSNVRLSRTAVGESSGRSKLYLSDKLNVDHRAYMAEKDSPVHPLPIEIVALDYYFEPGERVDLIKMEFKDMSFTPYEEALGSGGQSGH